LPIAELRAEHGRARHIAGQGGTPSGLARQVMRFCLVGAFSTVVFTALFLLLRPRYGSQSANVLALLLTAIGNTAANRYFTFGIRARAGVARHHAQGLLVFGFALALNAVALRIGRSVFGGDGAVDVIAVLTASVFAALVRFLMLRRWVFGAELPSRARSVVGRTETLPRQRSARDSNEMTGSAVRPGSPPAAGHNSDS
jgi:putative flippase GtrA